MPSPEPKHTHHEDLLEEIRERVRRDRKAVSADVRPLLEVIGRQLFDPDLDVNLLTRTCAPSRTTLRRFQEQLGRTPWAYITELRMEAAELLLGETGMKVWQVGEAVGCKRGFSARFRQCRGRSPQEVRRAPRHRGASRRPPAALQRLDGRPPAPRPTAIARSAPAALVAVELAPESAAAGGKTAAPTPTLDEELELFRRTAEPTLGAIGRAAQEAPWPLRPVLAKIRDDVFEPGFTVTRLKRELGIRDNELMILFHRRLGLPPGRYLRHARLDTSARWLRTTPLSAEAVAPLVGYSDSRALRRAFGKWSGFSPEEYGRVMAVAAEINETARTFAPAGGGQESADDGDPFLGWTVTTARKQRVRRTYGLGSPAAAQRLAERVVHLGGVLRTAAQG